MNKLFERMTMVLVHYFAKKTGKKVKWYYCTHLASSQSNETGEDEVTITIRYKK